MLRRIPGGQKQADGTPTSATSGGYGIVVKPFKVPSALGSKRDLALPARKRKLVSYKGQGGGSDGESDEEGKENKKSKFEMGNKVYGEDGVLGGMGKWCNRKFDVFKPKERTIVFAKTSVRSLRIRSQLTPQIFDPRHDEPKDVATHRSSIIPCFPRSPTTPYTYAETTPRSYGRPRHCPLRPYDR